MFCHPITGGTDEEATLDPTCASGQVLMTGSRIVTTIVVGAGGLLEGASSSLSKG